jgi:anti-sigma28 factor (negative regulator of flagellin synthesis)
VYSLERGVYVRYRSCVELVADRCEADAVEISPFARFVAMARENPVREDLIESIRQQIADGTYDTDDKFDRAFDEMLSDLR